MPLNIFEPRVKFPTFLICPAAPSGPETLQQLVSAAVTLVTRAVNVPSRSFKVPGEDTILNQGGYDGRGQWSCKCNYVDFYKDARPHADTAWAVVG